MAPTRLPSTHYLRHQSRRQRSKIYPRNIRRGVNMRIHLFSSSALLVLTFLIVAATVQADGNEQPRRSVRHKFSRLPAVKALPSKAKTTSTVTTPQPPKLLRGGSIVPAPSTMIRPIQTFLTALGEVKSHLAAAAVARSSSLLACYPIDTVKIRIQTSRPNPFGVVGLYGGIGCCLFGQIPYAALTFGSYEQYKKILLNRFPKMKTYLAYAIAAVLADVTGSGWLCPAEVVKHKLQAKIFKSTGQAVSHIWSQDGPLGFYRGYWNSLLRDVPFRMAQLTTYEMTKNFYLRFKRSQRHPTFGCRSQEGEHSLKYLSPRESAVLGGVAGCISTVITQPMDVLRTLMMTNSAAYGNSMMTCLRTVLHENGVGGIYTGLLPRLAYVAPSVAIFFIAYEMTQQRLKHWE